MPRPAQKSTLADWQKEDAARLLKLFRSQPKETRLSQEAFASRNDIGTQGNLWQYLHGYRALNAEVAVKFAAGLGCPVVAFSPRLAKKLGEMASAGSVAPAKVENRVAESVTLYGTTASAEGMLLGLEWDKLTDPLQKRLYRELIEVAVAAQERAKSATAKDQKSSRKKRSRTPRTTREKNLIGDHKE